MLSYFDLYFINLTTLLCKVYFIWYFVSLVFVLWSESGLHRRFVCDGLVRRPDVVGAICVNPCDDYLAGQPDVTGGGSV